MDKPALIAWAVKKACEHNLFPEIVCGIVERESSWNPWEVRFEAKFFKQYVAPLYTAQKIDITETYARSFSWGLGQVMGQTARERGFKGPLSQLCDPETGLEFLCVVLEHKLAVNQGNLKEALLAYNGGSNPNYPDEVLERAEKYKSKEKNREETVSRSSPDFLPG